MIIGGIDPLRPRVEVVKRMAERRTWYVATLSLYHGILTWARKQRASDPYALAGLNPAQALRAATAGGAAFLRASDRLGAIAQGFEADLILLSRNPLDLIENSRRIVAVIADGRVIGRS